VEKVCRAFFLGHPLSAMIYSPKSAEVDGTTQVLWEKRVRPVTYFIANDDSSIFKDILLLVN
jgi:hypothetical protein